ncbi:MAG TPA: hypothetical protein VG326_21620 [Tepidisphaeraceae bacterium]|nr:hypothetical protein [Tepidisphaeraceae bacterium]
MGIRETINEKPVATLIVAVVVIGCALGFLLMPKGSHVPKLSSRSYYSDDDGKTWYIDDAKNVPPYDHNGKQAVRAYLYKCADGKPFVQRLEMFDISTKEAIEGQIRQGVPPLEAQLQVRGIKIKRPADEKWAYVLNGTPQEYAAFQKVMTPHCPDGSPTPPAPVTVEDNAPSPH